MWFSIVYGSRKSYCIFRLSSAAIKPNPSYFSVLTSQSLQLVLKLDDMAVLSAAQLLEKTWAAQPFLR